MQASRAAIPPQGLSQYVEGVRILAPTGAARQLRYQSHLAPRPARRQDKPIQIGDNAEHQQLAVGQLPREDFPSQLKPVSPRKQAQFLLAALRPAGLPQCLKNRKPRLQDPLLVVEFLLCERNSKGIGDEGINQTPEGALPIASSS